MDFQTLLASNCPILLDGGMGTMLQAKGLPLGAYPELAAIEHPDWLLSIHNDYIEAGSQIIASNTFGVNREKLNRIGQDVTEVITASVAIAKQAAAGRGLVALDIGPIGQMLEPTGILPFETAVEIFSEIVTAGVSAGADVILIETMTDLQEARAALLAAKECSTLPVLVTMTYEATGRTFLGCDVSSCALTLTGMGADAIGINCSLGPDQMEDMVQELMRWTNLPLVLKPNAGLPHPSGSGYDITPAQFATSLSQYVQRGVTFVGGCCGTTPEYIRLLAAEVAGKTATRPMADIPVAVCSGSCTVPIDRVRVIGERINPTGKKPMKEALRRGDVDFMLGQALEQMEAGADILDVNVGLPEIDEPEMMVRVIKALQGVTDAPLQIDSTDPKVIEGALRIYCGKAIVNSVNGEKSTMSAILPIVKKYGAAVVGLTLDEAGIPQTAQARVDIAQRILDTAIFYGICRDDVFIDCLTLTASAEQAGAKETLIGLRRVKEELGLKTVLGVSNISFGLPARPLVNQNFLTMAMTYGLDLPILNPNADTMMAAVRSYHLLMNIDNEAREFIAAYAGAEVGASITTTATTVQSTGIRGLGEMIEAGLRGEVGFATKILLDSTSPMEIVDNILIPALDNVGMKFEAGTVFLPQLIQAAAAAQVAFSVIREQLVDGTEKSRGTIVLATVKGDIHDIGKNIVKVLLENYGYTIIDLGKDVSPTAVVDAIRSHNAPLVGLSALMTTTVRSMEETIRLIHAENLPCKVMVGGAVLTAEYAKKIKADFYAKDAKESVDIAKQLMK